MRKPNTQSFKNIDNYQTSSTNILIRAATTAGTPKTKEVLFSEEPTRLEKLGQILKMLRRKNNLDYRDLALKSSCTPESIIALEMGLLPLEEIGRNLPNILLGLGMERSFVKEMLNRFKIKGS